MQKNEKNNSFSFPFSLSFLPPKGNPRNPKQEQQQKSKIIIHHTLGTAFIQSPLPGCSVSLSTTSLSTCSGPPALSLSLNENRW